MGWLFGQEPEAGELSLKVKEALFIQFGVQDRIAQLRCAQRASRLDGRPIRHIRIFDPALFEPGAPSIRRFEDLDSHPNVVLFHGYLEKNGPGHLTKSQSFNEFELQKLPNSVRNALVDRYNVAPSRVGELRWVAKVSNRAGLQVRLVRIYDPAMLQVGVPAVRKYDDLDRYPDTILLHGYIDVNNALYLSVQNVQSQARVTESILKRGEEKAASRYLVVAHQTATSLNLLDQLKSLAADNPEVTFTLLVPTTPAIHLLEFEMGDARSIAERKWREANEFWRSSGLKIEHSQVIDASPVRAIQAEMRTNPGAYKAIVLGTLPQGISRWLRLDVLSKIEREFNIPVIHVVSQAPA